MEKKPQKSGEEEQEEIRAFLMFARGNKKT